MGFLDKFRKKKGDDAPEHKHGSESPTGTQGSSQSSTTGKRIKKYTSEGKPIYE
jgi:hypothetical protein